MDATRTPPVASHRFEFAREAEVLVRRLAGVRHARVLYGPRGIEAVHVVAHDHDTAPLLAARVRSALLAGLAAPVLPARIHVRVADDAPAPHPDTRTRTHDPDDTTGRSRPANGAGGPPRLDHGQPLPEPTLTIDGTSVAAARARAARPRLVAVDLERRADDRVLCRVAVAFHARVHSAAALAVDLPGAAAQAAAQATVRALGDAGIPGLELNGLREVEIAGRDFVIVALRRIDGSMRLRSGSAPVIGSAERAAAEATVVAVNELI